MVKLFFKRNDEILFVEISSETHERLRLHLWKISASLQQMADLVHEKFGDVSEELILRYLDRLDQKG